MEHAAKTEWDTLVEQLRKGVVPYLKPGTRDPTRSLYWMLVGFNVQEQDYPAATQHFNMSGPKFFTPDTCQMATKCKLCLRGVFHSRRPACKHSSSSSK